MTLKTLGQGHQNLIISKACLSDVSANSEKISPLVQKIYPTYNSMNLKKDHVTNNKHVSNLLPSNMQARIKIYNFDLAGWEWMDGL